MPHTIYLVLRVINVLDNIRAWLIANHVQLGVQYVLFVGNPHPTSWDTNHSVPMKMCLPISFSANPQEAATDMYYGELSGNWDLDGDGIYGEYFDDFVGGGFDMYCEVAVGRIPVYDTGTTQIDYLDSILQKTISYERSADRAWRKNYLGSAGFDDGQNGSFHDTAPIIETFKNNVCVPNSWGYTRLYQQGSRHPSCDSGYDSEQELRGEEYGNQENHHSYHWQNNDYGISMWYGHGSYAHASVGPNSASDGTLFRNYMANSLDNTHPSFLFPISCNNGRPETSVNLCVSVLRNGGIGVLSPSRLTAVSPWENNLTDSSGACCNYYTAMRMVSNQEVFGVAWNWVHSHGGFDLQSGSLLNHLGYNIYGDPSVGLYTFVPIPTGYSATDDILMMVIPALSAANSVP